MAPKIFLTIGIPTWNRLACLRENLHVLIHEIQKLTDNNIEILISDNASNDETEAYCCELAQHYPFIHYHRNPENLGANANFQKVIELASGQYVWLLGDDDLIVENCLTQITHDIQIFNSPAVIIGGALHDTMKIRPHLKEFKVATLVGTSLFENHTAIEVGGKISVLIFRRDVITSLLPTAWQIIQKIKTPWPHLIWLLLVTNQGGAILILPYATNYYLSRNWHNLIFDGITLNELHVNEYLNCITALRPYLSQRFFHTLLYNATSLQRGELLKCSIYATYLNKYKMPLKHAWSTALKLPAWKNKLNYVVFYCLPVSVPCFIRKFLLVLLYKIFPNWQAYTNLINNLEKAKTFLSTPQQVRQRFFDKKGL